VIADKVEAAPVRAHVERLIELGMTKAEIARAAGVNRGRITLLLTGYPGNREVDYTETSGAERIMAVDCSTIELESPWKAQASCSTETAQIIATQYGAAEPLDLFYPPTELDPETAELYHLAAVALCDSCPVAAQCDDYAAARPETFGIWAGVDRQETT